MTEATLPTRSALAVEDTWNAESVYATPADWDETCSICPGSGRGDLIPAEEIVKRSKVIRL